MSLEEDLCRLVRRARKQLVLEALIEGRADLNNLLVVLEGLNIILETEEKLCGGVRT